MFHENVHKFSKQTNTKHCMSYQPSNQTIKQCFSYLISCKYIYVKLKIDSIIDIFGVLYIIKIYILVAMVKRWIILYIPPNFNQTVLLCHNMSFIMHQNKVKRTSIVYSSYTVQPLRIGIAVNNMFNFLIIRMFSGSHRSILSIVSQNCSSIIPVRHNG